MAFLIAAVGKQGQLGLDGKLPWHDPQDLAWFKQKTHGAVVVVGPVTAEKLPPLPDRDLHIQRRHEDPRDIVQKYKGRSVYIAGGQTIYTVWLKSGLIKRSLISHINYDGLSDRVMPPLWEDDTGAIMENVKIETWIRETGRRLLATGHTDAAKLWGGIADNIKQVREKKWPFFKGFQ